MLATLSRLSGGRHVAPAGFYGFLDTSMGIHTHNSENRQDAVGVLTTGLKCGRVLCMISCLGLTFSYKMLITVLRGLLVEMRFSRWEAEWEFNFVITTISFRLIWMQFCVIWLELRLDHTISVSKKSAMWRWILFNVLHPLPSSEKLKQFTRQVAHKLFINAFIQKTIWTSYKFLHRYGSRKNRLKPAPLSHVLR